MHFAALLLTLLTLSQNLWHATANLDWWEVDLGQQYAVTKVSPLHFTLLSQHFTLF
jgi:hypothetical protein